MHVLTRKHRNQITALARRLVHTPSLHTHTHSLDFFVQVHKKLRRTYLCASRLLSGLDIAGYAAALTARVILFSAVRWANLIPVFIF